jgi:prevent-host-death family protein
MIVNSTEVKNNFGKYLRLSIKEDVIITSNGRKVARLISYNDSYEKDESDIGMMNEGSVAYEIPPRKVTYEEFLEISENSDQRLEYIDGEIYVLSSPKTIHQAALSELHAIFYEWFRGKKCKPMLAPYDITLHKKNGDINVVQPDIMVICDLDEKLNERNYYTGTPTLVVEIISEGTRSKDFINKMNIYMFSGVREYWIVNPINRDVSVYYFDNCKVVDNFTVKGNERVASFVFEGLGVVVEDLFR